MRTFAEHFNESRKTTERRFGFEEFDADTASVRIPPGAPESGVVTVPTTEKTLERFISRDKETGERRVHVKEDESSGVIDLEFEITMDPFAGPEIDGPRSGSLKFLRLTGHVGPYMLIPRPPRTRRKEKTGKEYIEEDLDKSKHIVMDGKDDRGRVSDHRIIYFKASDLSAALASAKSSGTAKPLQQRAAPQGRKETSDSSGRPSAGFSAKSIMTPSEITDWAIGSVAKAIERGLRDAGVRKTAVRGQVIVYAYDGVKKAFKVFPPSKTFVRNKWEVGTWTVKHSDGGQTEFLSDPKQIGVSPVTSGIIPNTAFVSQRVKSIVTA